MDDLMWHLQNDRPKRPIPTPEEIAEWKEAVREQERRDQALAARIRREERRRYAVEQDYAEEQHRRAAAKATLMAFLGGIAGTAIAIFLFKTL